MTGLNLESFLHLVRADAGAWGTLALIVGLLALMVWTSWGSRRALRKCLVLSVLAHAGVAFYGGTLPASLRLEPTGPNEPGREHLRRIEVARGPAAEAEPGRGANGGPAALGPWDRGLNGPALVDAKLAARRPTPPEALPLPRSEAVALDAVRAEPDAPAPDAPAPEARPVEVAESAAPPGPTEARPVEPGEVAPAVPIPTGGEGPAATGPVVPTRRLRPGGSRADRPALPARPTPGPIELPPAAPPTPAVEPAAGGDATAVRAEAVPEPVTVAEPGGPRGAAVAPVGEEIRAPERARAAAGPASALRATEARLRARRERPSAGGPPAARPQPQPLDGLALSRVVPRGVAALPDVEKAAGGRPLADVPEVYRTRLDPNRTARALEAGATAESEQAVERALDWLARHQDDDGRWNAATARYDDGTAVAGDADFTAHCPAGDRCFGTCSYYEADTALTGLALLAYLGSGYTQADGKYAETVARGLDFLRGEQKADGDLRGKSRAVGMYCHAMATLALSEAYALTADPKLRGPVQRATAFLVGARARDGMAWRYSPGEPYGDTSILGWVVLAFKSAREAGINAPPTVARGTLAWLDKVAAGPEKGLGRYTPNDPVTPTMTAEAWVCRQFLGQGAPGAASDEAADYLLAHGPAAGPYNLYYWYYGTLAMYQHGGDAWQRWNDQARDAIVRRQAGTGHAAGSWAPDESVYGAKGGRVYCTALAALSLEVYYRYLRLYDEPSLPATTPADGR